MSERKNWLQTSEVIAKNNNRFGIRKYNIISSRTRKKSDNERMKRIKFLQINILSIIDIENYNKYHWIHNKKKHNVILFPQSLITTGSLLQMFINVIYRSWTTASEGKNSLWTLIKTPHWPRQCLAGQIYNIPNIPTPSQY